MSVDPSVNALGSPGATMSLSEPQSDKLSLAVTLFSQFRPDLLGE